MVQAIGSKFSPQVDLREGVSQAFLNAKYSLSETAGKAANTIKEATSQIGKNFTLTADKAQETLSQSASKAVDTAMQAKDALSQTAVQTVDTVTTTTGKTVNTLAETAQQTGNYLRNSVENTFQKADQLSNSASTAFENTMMALLNHQIDNIKIWIDAHPTISWTTNAFLWGINHPILSLVIILLIIFIVWQLFKAIGSFVEKGFLYILKAPFKLVYFLGKPLFKSLGKLLFGGMDSKQTEENILVLKTEIPTSISQSQQERLATIMTRLEELRQEQNDLLQQVTAILTSEHLPHLTIERSSYLSKSEKN